MSYLLHPPSLDDLGLIPAVRSLAKGFTERSGIPTKLDLPDSFERLPRDVETALFRIIQESLSNIHRHSGSKTARISVSRAGDEIALVIRDEGKGFPPEILATSAELRCRDRRYEGEHAFDNLRDDWRFVLPTAVQT